MLGAVFNSTSHQQFIKARADPERRDVCVIPVGERREPKKDVKTKDDRDLFPYSYKINNNNNNTYIPHL